MTDVQQKKEKETEENSETEENREIRDPGNTQSYLETIRHESEVGWTSRHLSRNVLKHGCAVGLLQAPPHVQDRKWNKIMADSLFFLVIHVIR